MDPRIADLEAVAADHERRARTLRLMADNLRKGLPLAHGVGQYAESWLLIAKHIIGQGEAKR